MESKLSELPRGIQFSILQFMKLKFKDAVKISALSKDFKDLFINTSSLDFDDFGKVKGKKISKRVDRVLKLYRRSSMDNFRVCFPLKKTDSTKIDTWIEFAISKGMKVLELDFSLRRNFDHYPKSILELQYSLQGHILTLLSKSRLQSLCLKNVGVNVDDIENIIYECKFLERLHVKYSYGEGKDLTVKSKSLKFLAIKNWVNLKVVTIDATNLVQREFSGKATVLFATVPKLLEQASFGGKYCYNYCHPTSLNTQINFAQLTRVCFEFDLSTSLNEPYLAPPIFLNVKDLELRVKVDHNVGLFVLFIPKFFGVCPLLEKLKHETYWHCNCAKLSNYAIETLDLDEDLEDTSSELEFSSAGEENSEEDVSEENSEEDISEVEVEEKYCVEDVKQWLEDEEKTSLLLYLKRLEWYGVFDIPLALHIVKNAPNLDEFVSDPRSTLLDEFPSKCADKWDAISKKNAREMANVIPKRVNMVFLS